MASPPVPSLTPSPRPACRARLAQALLGLAAALGLGALAAQTLVPLTGVQRIEAGGTHTCAVLADGSLRCWGRNNFGQLGDGSTINRSLPTPVAGDLRNVSALAAGFEFTCALARNGGLHCWGSNSNGQLGDFTAQDRLVPEPVNSPELNASPDAALVALAAGGLHHCVTSTATAGAASTTACAGDNSRGQIGNDAISALPVTPRRQGVNSEGGNALAAGRLHTCQIVGGIVRCWGDNRSFQSDPSSSFSWIQRSAGVFGLPGGRAVDVATGSGHSCALFDVGGVWCWGDADEGQTGTGVTLGRRLPERVPDLPPAKAIDARGNSTCAVTDTGEVWCWGGQLGDLGNGRRARRLGGLEGLTVTAVAVGANAFDDAHACALADGGAVYCLGNNVFGQLGNGTAVAEFRSTMEPVLTELIAQSISFGAAPSGLRVGSSATVTATGGASGNPVVLASRTPAICSLGGSTVTALAVGTCTIAANQAGGGSYAAAPEATLSFDIESALQTITFANPGAQVFGTAPTLTATASSGLPVSFSASTPSVCTITRGGTLGFLASGTCTITADQAGNATFAAAPTVTQSFTVNAVLPAAPTAITASAGDASATVAFAPPSDNGGAAITLYTVTSSPAPSTGPTTWTGTTSPILITGLTNGRTYTFTVTATNSAGTSPASTPSNAVTPQVTFVAPSPRLDRALIGLRAGAIEVDVLANDGIDPALRAALVLSVPGAPSAGSAAVVSGAAGALPRLRYTPSGTAERDRVTYRACFGGLTACVESTLTIERRPLPVSALEWQAPAERGHRDQPIADLPALPAARFIAHGLVAAQVSTVTTDAASPADAPWRGGAIATTLRPLAGGSARRSWRVLVDSASLDGGDIDLFLGVDRNGNQRADADELTCASAGVGSGERCDLALDAPADGAIDYWIVVRGAGFGRIARVETFETPLDVPESQSSLVATGPGTLPVDAAFPLRFGWDDATWLPGEHRGGWVEFRADVGASLGWVPVRLSRGNAEPSAFALASGVDHVLALLPGAAHERLFIDVPPGTARLEATTRSADAIDLFLARVPPVTPSGAVPFVAAAPARAAAVASATTPSGSERLVIDSPAPGRWYVTPVSSPIGANARVTVRATLSGSAPRLQPGGYFNPSRSGTGLFVYPAGDQWAALWFTYAQDGTPTWFYLQAPRPGANGVWRSPIFRSAWDGARNRLTGVGEATITTTAVDAFTFSYTLDGETGGEAYANFSAGCPVIGGQRRNSSGLWFDPRTAGSGYVVQGFTDYEFQLVFAYDARGVPRYLAAERNGLGPAIDVQPLEQLRGACPLCARSGNPVRTRVGTLERTIEGGTLRRFRVDATYVDGVPGRWTADDTVIPLGELRGCAQN